jgi:divalent metal cation (Fe/Co/Zn/Cd) transporter
VVALMLFSLGGLFSIYEGVHKLEDPHPLEYAEVAIGVLIVAIILEYFSFMTCVKEARKQPNFKNFRQWIRETTSADILVLFLENLAALAGLTLALATLGLAWITGDATWDAIGSIAVGSLLILVAIVLAKEVKSLLIGEAPVTNYKDPISAILESEIKGAKLLKIIAIQHGIDCVVMAYKIFIDNKTISAHDMAVLVNNFEAKVKTQFPEIKWQFSEVDIID